MERLQLALTAEGAAPALADGGVPVADIAAAYPDGRLGRRLRRDVPGRLIGQLASPTEACASTRPAP